ncbi:MAG: glycosyltransferase [Rubellimicrobium sp.]|nr:glycosyltransferase [Rubellimicrobium sp.]
MLTRLSALFRRFASAHHEIEGPGFALKDAAGRRIGAVDRVRLRGGRIEVTGWALVTRATLQAGRMRMAMRPRLVRKDLEGILGPEDDRDIGFDLAIPRPLPEHLAEGQGIVLTLEGRRGRDGLPDPQEEALSCPVVLPAAPLAEIRLRLRFAAALASALPAILRWKLTRDPRHRATIKRRLGVVGLEPTGLIEEMLLRPAPPGQALPVPDAPVTLILPVYNAFDLLPEVLERIVTNTDLPWHLVVIEDASPDPRIRPFLRGWVAEQEEADPGRITLIENAANLGFIGSVNAGLALALKRGGHAVLVNSDAFVPQAWLSRLIAPILADPGVASVTPMSNDATIFSSPAMDRQTLLSPGQADRIDALARSLDPLRGVAPVPTGVGFCMALSRDFLARVPALDPVFGRGYGEEVDWCQKVRALGGRHLGTAALYVEHRGGTSFGSEEKLRLVAANNEIIASRYPAYDAEVQEFLRDDPLLAPRLALALAWAGAWSEEDPGRSVPVYLAHTLGGGADKYLDARIVADLAATGRPAVILRVGGLWRWQIEVAGSWGRTRGATDDEALMLRLLAPLRQRHVVYSCGVGHDDPLALPGLLLRLAGKSGDGSKDGEAGITGSLEILFHDFYPLSPAYTLLDADGIYRGPLSPDSMAARPPGSHALTLPRKPPVTLAMWRAAWAPALAAAEALVVFSEDSRRQVLAACPGAEARLRLVPHRLLEPVPAVARPAPPPRVIGVLGNIGPQKGAGVVAGLARRLAGRQDVRLVLLGNLDPDYSLPRHVPVHGDYTIADIPALVARYGITDWLIPSIWPETFSYTTHEALATGLPVMVFDLGAQADAARTAPNGRVLPLGAEGTPAATVIAALTGPDARAGS